MASILGGYSMTAYAAAKRFMDTFAQSRSLSEGPSWIAVNWDDWDFEYTKEQVGAYEKTTAQYAMSPDEGYETLKRILSLTDTAQILVSTRTLEPRVKQWNHQYAEREVVKIRLKIRQSAVPRMVETPGIKCIAVAFSFLVRIE
jgi:hypothetical protein